MGGRSTKSAAVADEKMLGAHQAGEGLHGQADGAQALGGVANGLGLAVHFDEAADGNAQQLDLLVDAGKLGLIEFV